MRIGAKPQSPQACPRATRANTQTLLASIASGSSERPPHRGQQVDVLDRRRLASGGHRLNGEVKEVRHLPDRCLCRHLRRCWRGRRCWCHRDSGRWSSRCAFRLSVRRGLWRLWLQQRPRCLVLIITRRRAPPTTHCKLRGLRLPKVWGTANIPEEEVGKGTPDSLSLFRSVGPAVAAEVPIASAAVHDLLPAFDEAIATITMARTGSPERELVVVGAELRVALVCECHPWEWSPRRLDEGCN
mmetsp:Transcript_46287/g.106860  ORF Transcript_46287/g.106860 Transcript_46287/m.106860 type:complete len:243 (-) Transcript_46287:31-759(-)